MAVTALRAAFLLQPKSLSEQKIYSTAIYIQLKVLSGAILRSNGRQSTGSDLSRMQWAPGFRLCNFHILWELCCRDLIYELVTVFLHYTCRLVRGLTESVGRPSEKLKC